MSSKIMYVIFNHICIPLRHVCMYIILMRIISILYVVMVSHLFNCILLIIMYNLPICYSYIILLQISNYGKKTLKEIINLHLSNQVVLKELRLILFIPTHAIDLVLTSTRAEERGKLNHRDLQK